MSTFVPPGHPVEPYPSFVNITRLHELAIRVLLIAEGLRGGGVPSRSVDLQLPLHDKDMKLSYATFLGIQKTAERLQVARAYRPGARVTRCGVRRWIST